MIAYQSLHDLPALALPKALSERGGEIPVVLLVPLVLLLPLVPRDAPADGVAGVRAGADFLRMPAQRARSVGNANSRARTLLAAALASLASKNGPGNAWQLQLRAPS